MDITSIKGMSGRSCSNSFINNLIRISTFISLIYFFSTHNLVADPSDSLFYLSTYILEETALDSEVIGGPGPGYFNYRVPDVSHIDGSNNFVVIYPKFNATNDLDAFFKIYDHDGNLIRDATLVDRRLRSYDLNNVGVGVDAKSNYFAALYSLSNPICPYWCTILKTRIFNSWGVLMSEGRVIDRDQDKAQDCVSRVMIHNDYNIVFSAFNRVEVYGVGDLITTDLDVMGSMSDFDPMNQGLYFVNSKFLLDLLDIEDDPDEEYRTDAANVALNGDKVLFVWTTPDEEVMGRLGDYIPATQNLILNSEFLIGYGESGGSVLTWSGLGGDPGNNRFLVVWDDSLDQIVGKFIDYDPFYVPPDPFLISEYPESKLPTDVAFLRSGLWVVTWTAKDPASQTFEVWGRVFFNRTPFTTVFRVNSQSSDAWSNTMPRISRVSNSTTNRFAVAWQGKEETNNQWFNKTFLTIMRFIPSD